MVSGTRRHLISDAGTRNVQAFRGRTPAVVEFAEPSTGAAIAATAVAALVASTVRVVVLQAGDPIVLAGVFALALLLILGFLVVVPALFR